MPFSPSTLRETAAAAASASPNESAANTATRSALGSGRSLNETSTITPSVPSEPQ